MAGGDMHVQIHTGYYKGVGGQVVDANSKPSGDMQTAMQIGGKTAYLTEEGASALQNEYEFYKKSLHTDTTTKGLLFKEVVSNLPKQAREQHLGTP